MNTSTLMIVGNPMNVMKTAPSLSTLKHFLVVSSLLQITCIHEVWRISDTLIRFSNNIIFSSLHSITIIIIFLRVAHQVLNSASIAVQAEKHVQVNTHHHAFESQVFANNDVYYNNRKNGIIRIRNARCCYIRWVGCRLSQGTKNFQCFTRPLFFTSASLLRTLDAMGLTCMICCSMTIAIGVKTMALPMCVFKRWRMPLTRPAETCFILYAHGELVRSIIQICCLLLFKEQTLFLFFCQI